MLDSVSVVCFSGVVVRYVLFSDTIDGARVKLQLSNHRQLIVIRLHLYFYTLFTVYSVDKSANQTLPALHDHI